MDFQPDESQRRVIALGRGRHLVLAPPGCGKTQILTERVVAARSRGIDYADMLMLTFTNRAARVMQERISQAAGEGSAGGLYVGNIHRFCSHFLFNENILSADASVIDENEAYSILANHFSEDETLVVQDFARRRQYAQMVHFSNTMRQIELGHEAAVRLHPECITAADKTGLVWLCDRNHRAFDRQAMIDIYNNVERILQFMSQRPTDSAFELYARPLLLKMAAARIYADYKEKHNLFDFNDLLILTYETLRSDREGQYHRYKWIQVDEVQDLSPLQLAIVDELTDGDFHSVTYLGDEQQAIFSFMGAKLSTLEKLKEKCGGDISHLSHNHRSPSYMLEVFNAYARSVLDVPPQLLPDAAKSESKSGGELAIVSAAWPEMLPRTVADVVASWQEQWPGQTTAVIVQSNREADTLSDCFAKRGVGHFKVSGQDVFDSSQMKFLVAHLDVALHDGSLISWSRILTAIGVCRSAAEARDFIIRGLRVAVTPSDLLRESRKSYIEEFLESTAGDVVVFDTETTGLDVATDDILQIAAVRLRGGKKVEGSDFCVYIDSQKPIPEMLGDIENPIIEERRRHRLYPPEEALRLFADYAAGYPLIGHNSLFDYSILHHNLSRYLPSVRLGEICPQLFDTLRLSRLLCPRLKQYRLKNLIAALGLEGENTHLADADVAATCSLTAYCMDKARGIVEAAREFVGSEFVQRYVVRLREIYAPHYRRLMASLNECGHGGYAAMTAEMLRLYGDTTQSGLIAPLGRMQNVADFIQTDVLRPDIEPTLLQQLQNHLHEMASYKESDLCASSVMREHVFISTIHKAKGLEFDNVVVYDLRDDRLPGSYYKSEAEIDEKKRLVYVAMTRARRRLALAYPQQIRRQGRDIAQQLSRFVLPIRQYFDEK